MSWFKSKFKVTLLLKKAIKYFHFMMENTKPQKEKRVVKVVLTGGPCGIFKINDRIR